MPPISFKKIAALLLGIIILSQMDKVLAALSGIYQFVADSLAPFNDFSPDVRYAVMILLLMLAFVTIFRLLQGRK